MINEKAICIVDNHYGIYIPQVFLQRYADAIVNKAEHADAIAMLLKGPDAYDEQTEYDYNDDWSSVYDHAIVLIDGKRYELYQDGDLWAVPEGEAAEEEDNEPADCPYCYGTGQGATPDHSCSFCGGMGTQGSRRPLFYQQDPDDIGGTGHGDISHSDADPGL